MGRGCTLAMNAAFFMPFLWAIAEQVLGLLGASALLSPVELVVHLLGKLSLFLPSSLSLLSP